MKTAPIVLLTLAPLALLLAQDAPLGPAEPPAYAALNEPVPDFSLLALDGSRHELSRLRGRIVVLEWFNLDCPYSAKYHRSGLLRAMHRELSPRGVTWLAVASGSAAASADRLGVAAREWKVPYPILRDQDGAVARAFRAQRTPHLFVIDRDGVLRYSGALDDATAELDRLGRTNYVLDAVGALLAGRRVETQSTTPHGTMVSRDLSVDPR